MNRAYGTGTVFQRADGRWIARYRKTVDGRRRSTTFSSTDREIAETKLNDWMRSQGLRVEPRLGRSRNENLKRARQGATHSKEEWEGLLHLTEGCTYCSRPTAPHMKTKDHATPVSRGGSDGIDNLRVSCWDCNYAKRDMNESEFVEWAQASGFFTDERRWEKGRSGGFSHKRDRPKVRFTHLDDGRVGCTACGKTVTVTMQEAARMHRGNSGSQCPNSGRRVHDG